MSHKCNHAVCKSVRFLNWAGCVGLAFGVVGNGNPWWVLRHHDDLSRGELALDYFTHGAGCMLAVLAFSLSLTIKFAATKEIMRAIERGEMRDPRS